MPWSIHWLCVSKELPLSTQSHGACGDVNGKPTGPSSSGVHGRARAPGRSSLVTMPNAKLACGLEYPEQSWGIFHREQRPGLPDYGWIHTCPLVQGSMAGCGGLAALIPD